MKTSTILLTVFIIVFSCSPSLQKKSIQMEKKSTTYKVEKSEEEWKKVLTPEQYVILREAGTERPFSGKYNLTKAKGTYKCAGCGEDLFSSDAKFESNCGWPSFDKEIEEGKIIERIDDSHGMQRIEILCGSCGGHLGHVFDDGPTGTGLRYCVNSLSLELEPTEKKE